MQISSKQTAGHSSPRKKLCVFHCRGGNSDIMFTLALEERERGGKTVAGLGGGTMPKGGVFCCVHVI